MLRSALLLSVAALLSAADPRDDASPWGIAPGAEGKEEYPMFNPLLQQAGTRWIRLFPAWNKLQPKQGEWDWAAADEMLANAKAHGMRTSGGLWFLAAWASAGGKPLVFPLKELQHWRDYVTGVVTHCKADIRWWEVWNEFNGGFAVAENKPKVYADLVKEASLAAKTADPGAMIGISCANFDLNFFDATIKAGAAGHFDFVCVHPYENLGFAVTNGGERGYLSMAGSIRRMLAANGQRPDMPLWITEIGRVSDGAPVNDALQAEALVKAYVLSLAQGFARVFWFEAVGPAIYGKQKNEAHGIIHTDGTPRPAYHALQAMAKLLGPEPRYAGWLDLEGAYGFVFDGASGPVLAAWAPPGGTQKPTFASEMRIMSLVGDEMRLAAGAPLALKQEPVWIAGLPAALADQARSNAGRPFPWGGDYSAAKQVVCRLGATVAEEGLQLLRPERTTVVIQGDDSCRRLNFDPQANGRVVPFRLHDSFVAAGAQEVEITVVACPSAAGKPASMKMNYETVRGYKDAQGRWDLDNKVAWQEHTWRVTDANFVGQWGFSLRIDAQCSQNEFLVREVRVTRIK